jgi:hypothetical protein
MLTPAQLRAQVASIRKRSTNGARAIAIQAQSTWTGPDSIEVEGEQHAVFICQSDLQVREALLRSEQGHCILLCSFGPEQLGDDVLARVAKGRVFPPQHREVLAELFGARIIDPRVLSCTPLVEALVAEAQGDGYRPVAGGSLDLLTAWSSLLSQLFKKPVDGPSLTAILRWSLDPPQLHTLTELPTPLRSAMVDWMCATRGQAPRFMIRAASAGAGPELLPLGLLLALLFQAECRGTAESRAALARLERYFDQKEIDEQSALAWATAAEELLCEMASADPLTIRPALATLDRLIDETRVAALVHHSRYSPTGIERRFEILGHSLSEALDARSSASLERVQRALVELNRHFLVREHTARIARGRMALRLAAWLQTRTAPGGGGDLSAVAQHYWSEGGFVDLARGSVEESDPCKLLRDAYERLLQLVNERCAVPESQFIRALQQWCEDGGTVVLPIERVLLDLVGPAARQKPALLLVLDGMSIPAFQQLLEDLLRHDWVELGQPELGIPRPVLAALPSITEISRWSLFAGRIATAGRSTEKTEFQNNRQLAEVSGSPSKPLLFTKGDLSSGDRLGLADEVRNAILNARCRLVAVVVNAMDDLLGGGEQVALSWGIDSIRLLRELLHTAREAERLVLLTSDHGHVLDNGSRQLRVEAGDAGDRFRPASGDLADGEAEFHGPRIEKATGKARVVCLTRRQLRYQTRKRGYHGGASVQEVVIPFAALHPVGSELPEGWQERPQTQPTWWNADALSLAAPVAESTAAEPVSAGVGRGKDEGDLFTHAARRRAASEQSWLNALFVSELYREQLQRAPRGAPTEELMRRLLRRLADRGGSMLRTALAQQLELPPFRIDGLTLSAGRILNIDGYEVLSFDRSSDTVILNLQLLKSQFALE